MWLLIDAGISAWLPLKVSCLHKISEEKIMATNFREAKGLASWKKVQNKAGVELDADEKTGVHKVFRNSCTCFSGQKCST